MTTEKETYFTLCKKYNITPEMVAGRVKEVSLSENYIIEFTDVRIQFLKQEDDPKVYFKKRILHRLDGPAVIHRYANKIWIFNGFPATKELTKWAKENGINLSRLTVEDKALIKLIWSDYGK